MGTQDGLKGDPDHALGKSWAKHLREHILSYAEMQHKLLIASNPVYALSPRYPCLRALTKGHQTGATISQKIARQLQMLRKSLHHSATKEETVGG